MGPPFSWARGCPETPPSPSVLGWPLNFVDNEHVDRPSRGLQLEPELLLERREQRRAVRIDRRQRRRARRRVTTALSDLLGRPGQIDVVVASQARSIDDNPLHVLRQQLEDLADWHTAGFHAAWSDHHPALRRRTVEVRRTVWRGAAAAATRVYGGAVDRGSFQLRSEPAAARHRERVDRHLFLVEVRDELEAIGE